MAGTVKASVLQHDVTGAPPAIRDGAGTEIGQFTKAWCNYNGVSAAIRASFNTSSVTKGATAKYQFFFSVACADANFSFSGSSTAANETGGSDGVRWLSSGSTYHSYVGRTSSDIKTVVAYDSANATDGLTVNIAINR